MGQDVAVGDGGIVLPHGRNIPCQITGAGNVTTPLDSRLRGNDCSYVNVTFTASILDDVDFYGAGGFVEGSVEGGGDLF